MSEDLEERSDEKAQSPEWVIGIGASAGGLEALTEFLSALPPTLENAALIVAQHLSPNYKSMLVQLLQRETTLLVSEARHQLPLAANAIYVTPPDCEISLQNGAIQIGRPSSPTGPKPSVNILFKSLAQAFGLQSIGVILSGTGSDGAEGIMAIHEAGGITMAQDPANARYDGMPQSARLTQAVQYTDTPANLARLIVQIVQNQSVIRTAEPIQSPPGELLQLLGLLTQRTGTDFSNYKSATFGRRLEKRMRALGHTQLDGYLEWVRQNPEELDALFNTLLIGVTRFFRDPSAFDTLKKALAELLLQKKENESLRIWVPGCATGEEAYSIAILVNEIRPNQALQIFATDIDEAAIAKARLGLYSTEALEFVPPPMRESYFLKKNDHWEIIKSIRTTVLFSKHDVTQNPPFLRLDLISCRNLLIYFNNSLQQQVFPVFHYALKSNGLLFLGSSESVGTFTHLFATIDKRNKLFRKKNSPSLHSLDFSLFKPARPQNLEAQKSRSRNTLRETIKEQLYENIENGYLLVNENAEVMEIRGEARDFLVFPEGLLDVRLYRLIMPEWQTELRSLLTLAFQSGKKQKSRMRRLIVQNEPALVWIKVLPFRLENSEDWLALIFFERLEPEEPLLYSFSSDKATQFSETPKLRILELEHELEATKEHLQTYIEEIETANEELQSLNEELQSTNEELQSSNEELETSNEELQASNEELQIAYGEIKSVNEALEKKDQIIEEINANFKAIFDNTQQAFLLLDLDYRLLTFNLRASQLLHTDLKTGQSIFNHLPGEILASFKDSFEKVQQGMPTEGIFPLHSSPERAGKVLFFTFNAILDIDKRARAISVGLLDISAEHQYRLELIANRKLIHSVFNAVEVGVCVTDENGKFVQVNPAYCRLYGYQEAELLGQHFTLMVVPEGRLKASEMHDVFLETGTEIPGEWQVVRKDGSIMEVHVSAQLLVQEDGRRYKVTSVRDITETKRYNNLLNQTQESAQIGGWELDLLTGENRWTKEIYDIYEVPPDFEISPEKGLSFYSSASRELLEKALQASIEKGEAFDLDLEFVSAQNNFKYVRATCKPIRLGNRTIKLYGTLQDITLRRLQQAELQKLTTIVAKVNSGVLITNPEGLTEWCNEGFEKLTGYSAQEFIGQKPGIILQGPKTDPKTKARIRAKLKARKPFQEEILNYHKEGYIYWVLLDITPILDAKGQLTHYIGIQTDITERKKYENALQLALAKEKVLNRQLTQQEQELAISEEELRASLEQLRQREEALEMLVRQAPVGIQIMNAEGAILSVNAAWKACFGVEKSDLGHYNLFHDAQLLALTTENPLSQLLEGRGIEITDYEYDARLAFGEGLKIWIASLIYPLIDAHGQVKSLIMLHQDLSERKRTERQLFESTQLTQSIFQHSAAMIYAKNREGQYTKVNRQTADFFGTTIAKMMGKTAREVMQPEEARLCLEREASLLDEPRILNFQIDLQNQQGQNRCFQATEFPLFDEKGHVNGLAGIAFDMTDQIEKDRLYRLLAENSQDVIVYYDQDLKMRYISPSITLLTGFTMEEALQMENFALAHPDDRPELLQNLQKWLEDRVRYSKYSYRMVHKDGTVLWVESVTRRNFDEQGRLQEIIVNLRSIQEQMLARQELKASELKYRRLVEQSRDIIAMVDTQNLIIFISPAFQKILGYDSARLNEPGFMEKIIHPDDLARFRDFWEFYFQHQYFDEDRLLQLRCFSAEGEEIFLENSFVNLRDENGQLIGFQTLGRDITARRRAEERLRRSEASLKSIFDAAAESFILISKDFKILQFNRAAQEIIKANFGQEVKIGDDIFDYGDPNTFMDFRRKVARAWQGDKVFSEREINVNGRKYWFEVQYLPAYDENGEIMGVAFVSLDITQRKEDEIALLLSRENLSISQKIARLGSWSFQTDNRLICLRTEMLVLLGYTEELNDLYLPLAEYLQLHVEETDHTLFLHYFAGPPFIDADGKNRVQVEFAYKAKTLQGELRDFYVIAHYLAYEKSIIGVAQDITERKRNEAEREKMLFDLKRFAFMTSHNLRRPLANVLGLVYILKENEPEDPFNHTVIDKIQRSAEELDAIIYEMNQILEENNLLDTQPDE
ncbi:MAG: hypothetical protein OHK0053_09700 [Microscillaceae bacterium]